MLPLLTHGKCKFTVHLENWGQSTRGETGQEGCPGDDGGAPAEHGHLWQFFHILCPGGGASQMKSGPGRNHPKKQTCGSYGRERSHPPCSRSPGCTQRCHTHKWGKNVLLLSTKHWEPRVSEVEHQKPTIIQDYNRCRAVLTTWIRYVPLHTHLFILTEFMCSSEIYLVPFIIQYFLHLYKEWMKYLCMMRKNICIY